MTPQLPQTPGIEALAGLELERPRISQHFYVDEFTCRCGCERWCASYQLIILLEWLRASVKRPVLITQLGGLRCSGNFERADFNHERGGAPLSKHTVGNAADIFVPGWTPGQVYELIDSQFPNTLGLIEYAERGFVHVDVRVGKYRSRQ